MARPNLQLVNRGFEPIWNAVHVDHVDISWLESLTLEGRASYYDRAGALKDMVQNDLMEAIALVLMGQPTRMDGGSFRAACGSRACGRWPPRRRRRCAARPCAPATPPARSGPARSPPTSTNPGSTRPQHRNLRPPHTPGQQPPVERGPVHPAFGQGPGGGLGRDRHHFRPLPRYLLDQWAGVEPNVLTVGLTEPTCGCPPRSTAPNAPPRSGSSRRARHRPGSPPTPKSSASSLTTREGAERLCPGSPLEPAGPSGRPHGDLCRYSGTDDLPKVERMRSRPACWARCEGQVLGLVRLA
jgi:glucose-6-phosphate 1-dehydrogenase